MRGIHELGGKCRYDILTNWRKREKLGPFGKVSSENI
jgi:hypothetical protein